MSLRRMLPFILINVIVSTVVILLLLYWWDGREGEQGVPMAPTLSVTLLETPVNANVSNLEDAEAGATEERSGGDVETEEEDDGLPIHVVQAGETLGVISQQYDVPVEDIATANDIINVNSISVGQQLIIPIGGLPTETPPPTAIPTPVSTPTIPATTPAEEAVAMIEISEVIGLGDLTTEAVRISNAGTRPMMLRGWQLEDEEGNVYTFVDVTLYGSSDAGTPSILIHTEAGQNGPSDLFWGQETAVWQSGETVTLRDGEGTQHATYEIP